MLTVTRGVRCWLLIDNDAIDPSLRLIPLPLAKSATVQDVTAYFATRGFNITIV